MCKCSEDNGWNQLESLLDEVCKLDLLILLKAYGEDFEKNAELVKWEYIKWTQYPAFQRVMPHFTGQFLNNNKKTY